MSSIPTLRTKRGDSLNLTCSFQDGNGNAVSLVGYTVEAQIRTTGDVLLASLTATITDAAAGLYTLSVDADATETWAPATYVCDIQYTDSNGTVSSTSTFRIEVLSDITRATP